MGYLKVKSGKYRITARIRRDGRIYHKQQTIDCSRERAKLLFEQFKRELREGEVPQGSLKFHTFSEALTFYMERHNTGKSTCYFNRLIEDLGSVPILQLSDSFDRYIQLLKHSRVKNTGKTISNGTLNQYILRSRAALNFAIAHNKISVNPIKNFKLFKTIPRDMVLNEVDRINLLNVIEREASHLSPIIRYALQIPSRRSELVNMLADDLDLINGCIRVRNGTSKNDIGHYKPIPPDMESYFRSIPKESKYIFYRYDKKGYHCIGDFKRSFKRCLRIAGIQGFQFRDTRHISASMLADNNTPEQVIMQVANWKTNMLRTYYHRAGKNSLKLVRFNTQCDSVCDSVKAKAV